MNDFVKDLANKGYRYLPYLWSIRIKTEDTWLSLEYWLKNAKIPKILILTLLGNYKPKAKVFSNIRKYKGFGVSNEWKYKGIWEAGKDFISH